MTVLETFSSLSAHLFIAGEMRRSRSGDAFDSIDPATEAVNGQVANATMDEIEQAVEAANAAQRRWWALNAQMRTDAIHEISRRLRESKPRLAEALSREMGKTYKEAADEVEWTASAFAYYAELGRHETGRVMGANADGQLHFTVKEPLGVVAIVLPFNFPYVLFAWQAGAALATGNAVILKPGEVTSLCSLMLIECFDHLPAGLVQCITGGASVGASLVGHEKVHGVCFTGSVAGGQAVAKACAGSFKRVLIEASGNDPFIVMPSAPIEIAAKGAAFGAYLNCGQVCAASERFYVHEKVYDAFVDKLIEETKKVRIGSPLEKVDMGPMSSQKERDRYESMIAKAKSEGAKVRHGGGRPAAFNKGYFVDCTVLSECDPEMEILNRESFGPVAPVCRVASFEEAVARANASKLALGSTIYTTDLGEAMRAVNEIEAGMVWVNAPLIDNDAGPFGGRKMSGMGRQLGAEGLEQFRHTKLAMIDPKCQTHDWWWFPYKDSEAYGGGQS